MNTIGACTSSGSNALTGGPLSRARARWNRWLNAWRGRAVRQTHPTKGILDAQGALVELDARTLRDIGAPEQLLAQAMAREEARRHEYDQVRIALASGVRHFR